MAADQQIYAENPEDLPALFARAWNQRDADGIANLFVEDAEFVNVVGLWWHKRAAIRKAHDYGLRVIFSESELRVRRIRVRQLGANHALVHARMTLQGQSSHEGKEASMRSNVFSFVLEKRALGWVAISAHNTDQIPGKETNLINKKGQIEAVDYRN